MRRVSRARVSRRVTLASSPAACVQLMCPHAAWIFWELFLLWEECQVHISERFSAICVCFISCTRLPLSVLPSRLLQPCPLSSFVVVVVVFLIVTRLLLAISAQYSEGWTVRSDHIAIVSANLLANLFLLQHLDNYWVSLWCELRCFGLLLLFSKLLQYMYLSKKKSSICMLTIKNEKVGTIGS